MSRGPYPELVMEHARAPRNAGGLEAATHDARCTNPLCGDRIHLRLRLQDDRVRAIRYEAKGCALARASASILSVLVEGRSRDAALDLMTALTRGLAGSDTVPEPPEALRALVSLRRLPGRSRCVALPWEALDRALEEGSPIP